MHQQLETERKYFHLPLGLQIMPKRIGASERLQQTDRGETIGCFSVIIRVCIQNCIGKNDKDMDDNLLGRITGQRHQNNIVGVCRARHALPLFANGLKIPFIMCS
jgi:hypothetical protein